MLKKGKTAILQKLIARKKIFVQIQQVRSENIGAFVQCFKTCPASLFAKAIKDPLWINI